MSLLAPPREAALPGIAPISRAAEWAALALVVGGAGALRFYDLGAQSFWYDEAVTAALAAAPPAALAAGRIGDLGNPPLHPILLHAWTAVFGASDAALRALSAAAGTATLPVLYAVARRLVPPAAALLAAGLLAASPFHVYLGQEARPFALLTLLCTATLLALLRAVERPTPARWAAHAALAALALWTHYFAVFFLAGEALWALVALRRPPARLAWAAVSFVTAGLLFLPWLPALHAQLGAAGNLGRAADSWTLQIAATPLAFAVGTTLAWKGASSPLPLALAAAATLSLAAPAALGLWRARRDPPGRLVALWLLAPVALPIAVSLALFPLYHVRYVALAAPPFYLLAAAGLSGLSRPLRIAALGLVALGATASLHRYASLPVKHDWRGAVAAVEAQAAPGDLLLFDAPFNEVAWARYATGPQARLRLDAAGLPARLHAARAQGAPVEDVTDAVAAADRAWLVLSDEGPRRAARLAWFAERGWRAEHRAVAKGIEATLFVRGATDPAALTGGLAR